MATSSQMSFKIIPIEIFDIGYGNINNIISNPLGVHWDYAYELFFGKKPVDKKSALKALEKIIYDEYFDDPSLSQASKRYMDFKNGKNPTINAYSDIQGHLDIAKSIEKMFRYKSKLPEFLVKEMVEYTNGTTNIPNIIDRFEERKQEIFTDNNEALMKFVASELRHQLHHTQERMMATKREHEYCQMWQIVAQFNGRQLGSIFSFYNEKINPEGLLMQDIVKYPIPQLLQLIYPEYIQPKLNDLLKVPLDMIARELNVDYIYVHPLKRQGDILKNITDFDLWESKMYSFHAHPYHRLVMLMLMFYIKRSTIQIHR